MKDLSLRVRSSISACPSRAPKPSAAHAIQPVTAIQNEYSLWWRRPEEEVLPACEELGMASTLQPSGRGFRPGSIDESSTLINGDDRSTLPRFPAEARKANGR